MVCKRFEPPSPKKTGEFPPKKRFYYELQLSLSSLVHTRLGALVIGLDHEVWIRRARLGGELL